MSYHSKTRYLPIIIAVSIVAGIFIGTFYANRFSAIHFVMTRFEHVKVNQMSDRVEFHIGIFF